MLILRGLDLPPAATVTRRDPVPHYWGERFFHDDSADDQEGLRLLNMGSEGVEDGAGSLANMSIHKAMSVSFLGESFSVRAPLVAIINFDDGLRGWFGACASSVLRDRLKGQIVQVFECVLSSIPEDSADRKREGIEVRQYVKSRGSLAAYQKNVGAILNEVQGRFPC